MHLVRTAIHLTGGFALGVAGITLVTGLLAGSYPAIYLSSFIPVQVLKGKLKTALSEVLIRKGLVVFQFTLSIILIVSVGVIYRQIEFIQSKPLGYDRDHVLTVDLEGKLADSFRLQSTFLAEARRIPGVLNASATSHSFTGHNGGTWGVEWPGKDPNDRTEFEVIAGETDMTRTLHMTMREGRAFSRDYPSDRRSWSPSGRENDLSRRDRSFRQPRADLFGPGKAFRSGKT